jgi:hypothetical protein
MNGPLVIGGLGGSGTRVIAEMARTLGVYLGGTLNKALDNLWFTLLCKRPKWFQEWPHESEVAASLATLEHAMTRGLAGRVRDEHERVIQAAVRELAEHAVVVGADASTGEALLGSAAPPRRALWWGWKEPNSQLFVTHCAKAFPGLRYVHVIRHGLDMAYSRNQQQVCNWGAHFGLSTRPGVRPSPSESLEYWIRSNRAAIAAAREALGERFLLVRIEEAWERPGEVMRRVGAMVGQADQNLIAASRVSTPESAGRHAGEDLSWLTGAQRQAMRTLGYGLKEGN